MRTIASVMLVLAMWLAVVVGPQLNCWTWGPAMLALGIGVMAVLPDYARGRVLLGNGGMLALVWVVAGWFGARAWFSPVADYGIADLMLLACALGAGLVARAVHGVALAERVLVWGLALLLLTSVLVVFRQAADPAFTPGLVGRLPVKAPQPSGFYGHYNEGAHLLLGLSLLACGWGFLGIGRWWERVVLVTLAASGAVAVYLTASRSGVFGLAVGMVAFVVMALFVGKRRGARWFAPLVLALPLLVLAVAGLLAQGWAGAQKVRQEREEMNTLLDNAPRLHYAGMAVSCAVEHPLWGGGSRSFSWECFRYCDWEDNGQGQGLPEQVHNEFLQALTDYGIVGAGLLVVFVGTVLVGATVRVHSTGKKGDAVAMDAWLAGGAGALVGMLVQSMFNFPYHLGPGAFLLGTVLAAATYPSFGVAAGVRPRLTMVVGVVMLAIAVVGILLPFGWRGSRVVAARWDDFFEHGRGTPVELRLAAISEAIRLWPRGEFFEEGAVLRHNLLAMRSGEAVDPKLVSALTRDYEEAARRNPFSPGPVAGLATVKGQLGEDADALELFDRALALQGGMEGGFKVGLRKAEYLLFMAQKQRAVRDTDGALARLLDARATLVEACDFPSGVPHWADGPALRIKIARELGPMLAAVGREQEAQDELEEAALVAYGGGLRFYHAQVLEQLATKVWYQRKPGEALGLYLKARTLLSQAHPPLPEVSQEDVAALVEKLDKGIKFLKDAKVDPVPAETDKR